MGELHGCGLVALAYEISVPDWSIDSGYCAIDLVHLHDRSIKDLWVHLWSSSKLVIEAYTK